MPNKLNVIQPIGFGKNPIWYYTLYNYTKINYRHMEHVYINPSLIDGGVLVRTNLLHVEGRFIFTRPTTVIWGLQCYFQSQMIFFLRFDAIQLPSG